MKKVLLTIMINISNIITIKTMNIVIKIKEDNINSIVGMTTHSINDKNSKRER